MNFVFWIRPFTYNWEENKCQENQTQGIFLSSNEILERSKLSIAMYWSEEVVAHIL